jgi:hypothetical protein
MRILFLMSAISVILLPMACKTKSEKTQPSYKYDKMLFIRQGGGDKEFFVLPAAAIDAFQIMINHLNFQDTTITLSVSKDSANAAVFDAFIQTLNGQSQLAGDFTQPALPTGTWAHIYMIKGDVKTEITNAQLRNTLMGFERIVEDHLK